MLGTRLEDREVPWYCGCSPIPQGGKQASKLRCCCAGSQQTFLAIETLAQTFSTCRKYTGAEPKATKAMNDRFLQKVSRLLTFKETVTTRNKRPVNGWRHMTGKERVRQHRL